MRLKRVWRNVFGFAGASIIISLLTILIIHFIPQAPVEKVEYARLTLSQAASCNAGTYSRNLYKEAELLYDSAMVLWNRENKKIIFFRDFDDVEEYASLSAAKAEEAIKTSKANVTSLKIKIEHRIDTLNNIVLHLNKLFTSYPLSSDVRNRISKGKLLLKESEIAYSKEQFLHANRKIIDAEYFLTESYKNATNLLQEYFQSYPVWKKWVDQTISESRQNKNYSIIVDKYSRKCLIYYSGIIQHEYDVELGRNWVGDKRVKGDKATPEGMYKVIKKFGSNRTKYFKALLLDYPNEADKAEFRNEVERGTLPSSARIGGLIEIHGNGGKGIDWTEGCIAITDSEMEVVFRIAKEGTPVTIVGSMVDLNQVLD